MIETAEAIDGDWLKSVGIYPNDSDRMIGEPEFSVRIDGGSDGGGKESSDEDLEGDEIATLVVVPMRGGSAECYIDAYSLPSLNSEAVVWLGVRHTRAEVLDLCRALKAWGVRYDEHALLRS